MNSSQRSLTLECSISDKCSRMQIFNQTVYKLEYECGKATIHQHISTAIKRYPTPESFPRKQIIWRSAQMHLMSEMNNTSDISNGEREANCQVATNDLTWIGRTFVNEFLRLNNRLGKLVWQGVLPLKGHRNNMVIRCVAIQYHTSNRTGAQDANSWPAQLFCDSAKLKAIMDALPPINALTFQWYICFVPVDAEGNETEEPRLKQLTKVMVQRQLSFVISCSETSFSTGDLYLFGMVIQSHGCSLLETFLPDSSSTKGSDNCTSNVAHHNRAHSTGHYHS